MNRRDFLKNTALAAAAACVMTPVIAPAEPPRDPWAIFTQDEIKQHWNLVHLPVFTVGDRPYMVRTWKLKANAFEIPVKNLKAVQAQAKFEINRLGLTHVYWVQFNPAYVVYPDGRLMYGAYVRGATVK